MPKLLRSVSNMFVKKNVEKQIDAHYYVLKRSQYDVKNCLAKRFQLLFSSPQADESIPKFGVR